MDDLHLNGYENRDNIKYYCKKIIYLMSNENNIKILTVLNNISIKTIKNNLDDTNVLKKIFRIYSNTQLKYLIFKFNDLLDNLNNICKNLDDYIIICKNYKFSIILKYILIYNSIISIVVENKNKFKNLLQH